MAKKYTSNRPNLFAQLMATVLWTGILLTEEYLASCKYMTTNLVFFLIDLLNFLCFHLCPFPVPLFESERLRFCGFTMKLRLEGQSKMWDSSTSQCRLVGFLLQCTVEMSLSALFFILFVKYQFPVSTSSNCWIKWQRGPRNTCLTLT